MTPLSDIARNFFGRSYRSWRPDAALRDTAETEQLVAEISTIDEPAAIPQLLYMLAGVTAGGFNEAIHKTVAHAIQKIVEKCDAITLAQLDAIVRRASEWRFPLMREETIRQISWGLLGPIGILSFQSSGYTREAAVRLLSASYDGVELPFLLIRVNDWVEQVRDVARQAISDRIRPDYAAHFLRCLPLLEKISFQLRQDSRQLIDSITDCIGSDAARPSLLLAIAQGDQITRRLAFRFLVRRPHINLISDLKGMAKSRDPMIRWGAARELRQRLEGADLRTLLLELADDRFMPVRREALYGYVEKKLPEAGEVLRKALLDRHRSMREIARFHLSKTERLDLLSYYQAKIGVEKERPRCAAILGVGEVGKSQDAADLAPLLRDPSPRVKQAAIRAIGHLDAAAFLGELSALLDDERAGIARAARDAIAAHSELLAPARLRDLFMRATHSRTRQFLISLFGRLWWWDSAPLLIEATACEDPAAKQLALDILATWRGKIGRLTGKPSAQQLEFLRNSLDSHRAELSRAVIVDVEDHLRLASKDVDS